MPIVLGFAAAEACALTSADLAPEPPPGPVRRRSSPSSRRRSRRTRSPTPRRARSRAVPERRRHPAQVQEIYDRLDASTMPTVILMDPPFSASPHVEGRVAEAAMRLSMRRCAPLDGGRPVAITGRMSVRINRPGAKFRALAGQARVVFTPRSPARLTPVRTGPKRADRYRQSRRRRSAAASTSPATANDAAALLDQVRRLVPRGRQSLSVRFAGARRRSPPRRFGAASTGAAATLVKPPGGNAGCRSNSCYETRDWRPTRTRITASPYD